MDRTYIYSGFLWAIAGMVFGVYLGMTDQLELANTHAHANLLGFVLSVLFGVIYRSWPGLLESRFAWPQFVLFQTGTVVLVAGKFDIDTGGQGALAPPGSVLVVLGTLLMFWIFATAGAETRSLKRRAG